MGVDLNGEGLSCIDPDSLPAVCGTRIDGNNLLHRSEQIDQRRDVIRAHVKQRPAAFEIVERGSRMPGFMSVAEHERGACDHTADQPVVDQLAAGLMAAAEEGVRRASRAQILFLREFQNLLSRLGVQPERFFRIDVLARLQRHAVHLRMRLRRCQVQNDFNSGIRKQIRHGKMTESVFLRFFPGRVLSDVRARHELQVREDLCVLQIGVADVSTADQSDFHSDFSFCCVSVN